MATMFYDRDCDLSVLNGKKIAIIGYGSQGHAHALNLKESGQQVIVGLYEGSPSWKLAEEKGLTVMTAADAAKAADIIMMLVNDEKMPKIYEQSVLPGLSAGKTLCFAHGFNIHFGQILPPKDIDVIMIAPKGPGHTVRTQYEQNFGVPCLVAVQQDVSGKALQTALAYAGGVGGGRAGILHTTFREETETDLFGEQAVLCGGVCALMKAGFDTLVEAGYQPENAYFECVHEMKLIIDLVNKGGLSFMRYSISDTAEYGDYTVGDRIIGDTAKQEMKKVLTEIQEGDFARRWILENQAGRPYFNAKRRLESQLLVEKVGEELRSQMNWSPDKK